MQGRGEFSLLIAAEAAREGIVAPTTASAVSFASCTVALCRCLGCWRCSDERLRSLMQARGCARAAQVVLAVLLASFLAPFGFRHYLAKQITAGTGLQAGHGTAAGPVNSETTQAAAGSQVAVVPKDGQPPRAPAADGGPSDSFEAGIPMLPVDVHSAPRAQSTVEVTGDLLPQHRVAAAVGDVQADTPAATAPAPVADPATDRQDDPRVTGARTVRLRLGGESAVDAQHDDVVATAALAPALAGDGV